MRWDQNIVEQYITGNLRISEVSPIHLYQTHQKVKQNILSSRPTSAIGKSFFCAQLETVTKRLYLLANHVDHYTI